MSTETEPRTEIQQETGMEGEYRETEYGTFRYDSDDTARDILEKLAEGEGYNIAGTWRTQKAYSGFWPFAFRKAFRIENMLSPDNREVKETLREISENHLEENPGL